MNSAAGGHARIPLKTIHNRLTKSFTTIKVEERNG